MNQQRPNSGDTRVDLARYRTGMAKFRAKPSLDH
jgi:hypothetical protein